MIYGAPIAGEPTPTEQAHAPARLEALDGLRALAVGGVILTHAMPDRLPGGQVGVDVFFGLSGYLITSLLLKEFDRFGDISLRTFFARRALRLVPALLFFLLGGVAIGLAIDATGVWRGALSALTYTTDLVLAFAGLDDAGLTGHTWSLGVEEQFYLVWPLVLLFLLRRRPRGLLLATVVLIIGFLGFTDLLQRHGTDTVTVFMLPTTRLPELLIGALGAMLWRRGLAGWLARGTALTITPLAAVAAIVAWMFHDTWDDGRSYHGGFAAIALLTVLVVLHAEQRPGSLGSRLLSLRPAVLIGQRSYGIYLWHAPILFGLESEIDDRKVLLLVTLVLTAIAATISWHLVEAPALRLKRRFERVHLADEAPAPAPSPALT